MRRARAGRGRKPRKSKLMAGSFINRLTATLDKRARPSWCGWASTAPGEALAASHRSGNTWSRPQILDRLESATIAGSLHSLRDGRGIPHRL